MEVFLHGAKAGSDVANAGYSIGVALSLAFQHGTPLDALRQSVIRLETGEPADLIGVIVDNLDKEVLEWKRNLQSLTESQGPQKT